MCVWDRLSEEDFWKDFLDYKIEKQHLMGKDLEVIELFIKSKKYLDLINDIGKPDYIPPIPFKKEISKADTDKKRVIYSFDKDFNLLLKGIAFYLYIYDSEFADNCYAFRRNYGVKDAIRRIKSIKGLGDKYCLKLDVHNYFNSIDEDFLLEKLGFIKNSDEALYQFFEKLLKLDKAYVVKTPENRIKNNYLKDGYGKDNYQMDHQIKYRKEEQKEQQKEQQKEEQKEQQKEEQNAQQKDDIDYDIIIQKRGAMAGTPISPFFANVYLSDMDRLFESDDVTYFRYSDDILIFADKEDDIKKYQQIVFSIIKNNKLTINSDKTKLCKPKDKWEFLGFSYNNGEIDLSDGTIMKMKAKIKRKAHALRRWADRKNISGERAARAFIKSMNKKLFDAYYLDKNGSAFSWSRWFFPCITTDKGLKTLDDYMQNYIRFCVTGRHYKGNYRISYEMLKEMGYRNLVNEYWKEKNHE